MSRWQIEVGGKWYDMAQDEDSIVRKHYKKDGQFIINMRGSKFQFDFAKMEQTNLDKKHQKEKAVRKIRPPSTWIGPDGSIVPAKSGASGLLSCCSGASQAQSGATAEVIPPMDDEEVEGPADIPADAPPLFTPTPSDLGPAEEVAAPQEEEPPASTAGEVPTGTLKLEAPPAGSSDSAQSAEQSVQPGQDAGLKEQQPTSASPPATTWTAGLLGRHAVKAGAPPAATLPSGKQHPQPTAEAGSAVPGESSAAPEEQPAPQEVPPAPQPAAAPPPATTWAGASPARPAPSGAPPTATAPGGKLGGGQQQQQAPSPPAPADAGDEKSMQQPEQQVPEPPKAVPTKTLPVGKGPGKWGKPPLQTQ